MFQSDKPIYEAEQDKLGRAPFAKHLANAILKFETKDSYAIALQGAWGCGKTSVLHMVKEAIEAEDTEQKKIHIVSFNPWNFTDTNQLIDQFFVTLKNSLKLSNSIKNLNAVGTALEKYAGAFQYAELIPVAGKYLKYLPQFASELGSLIKENTEERLNDISFMKGEVEKALRELEDKILIIIDDIDRLPNEQIRQIFQLVNAVAGFPNTIYLLSYDKSIVARALGEVQQCDGEVYLEKIIQMPFDVPPINTGKLHSVLFEKIEVIHQLQDDGTFDVERWHKVFDGCIRPYIHNLRDVNRYCNALSFSYAAVREEVDFIDMAGICALQVFTFPIYEWIRDNKFTLTGEYQGEGLSMNIHPEIEESNLELFETMSVKGSKFVIETISILFPFFSQKKSFPTKYRTIQELHHGKHIAADKKFDLYFTLSLEDVKLSRGELDESFQLMDENKFYEYLNSLRKQALLGEYLLDLKLNLPSVPSGRIELLLIGLLDQYVKMEERGISSPPVDMQQLNRLNGYYIMRMMSQIQEEKCFQVIKRLILNQKFFMLQGVLEFLNVVVLRQGIIENPVNGNKQVLVSKAELKKLERLFLERIKLFTHTENIFTKKQSRRVFELWERMEEETYRAYIQIGIQNNMNAIRYAVLSITVWMPEPGVRRYELKEESYLKYITHTDAAEIIERERLKSDFWTLEEEVIKSAAALALIERRKGSEKEVSATDVDEFVGFFECEYLDSETY